MFWRARCHFCGSRQPHSKSVTEFRCSNCEAINFCDGKGNIVDTPAAVTAPPAPPPPPPPKPLLSFTHKLPANLQHQTQPSFCSTCQQNQHLFNAILAEYLPEESHPDYVKKERALPAYKKDLEKRYPMICKQCAPAIQSKINRADYYAMTRNVAQQLDATQARRGRPAHRTRDDAWKKFMRNLLRLIGLVLNLGLLAQVGFHSYGIVAAMFASAGAEPEFVDETTAYLAPTITECVRQARLLTFDAACYHCISALIPPALGLAAAFIWFNPGVKAWYHHTIRFEAVQGQRNYFYMQVIILAIRAAAWYTMSDAAYVEKLDKEQKVATHAFAIFFMLMTQAVANRSIKLQKWTMKGQVMPKPEEADLLGADAAEPERTFTSKPSDNDPWKYLRKEAKPDIDVNMFAPQHKKSDLCSSQSLYRPPPSPGDSESGDEDAMELDFQPAMRSSQRPRMNQRPRLEPTHTYANHTNAPPLSFGNVRSGLSGIEFQMRTEEQRRQQEQPRPEQPRQEQPRQSPDRQSEYKSPFYGRLPPAPMSMERRLRNPVLRPAQAQKVPLSQQHDFMAQMQRGIKPAQFPEKGSNFELKKSTWTLPSDKKELGFEDRFMKTFSLQDPNSPARKKNSMAALWDAMTGAGK